jgi:Uncharacterised protein family (UPF0175)
MNPCTGYAIPAIIKERSVVQVTIELPSDVAKQLQQKWGDVSRHILETIAVEGYRAGQLTTSQVREMLGYDTAMELDALLHRANLYRNPGEDELEQDFEASRRASTQNPRNQ